MADHKFFCRLDKKYKYRNLNTLTDLPVAALGTQLVEIDRFGCRELKSATDSKNLEVIGIADGDTPDTIYFVDSRNSKLNRLNLKTRQVDEVRYRIFILHFRNY